MHENNNHGKKNVCTFGIIIHNTSAFGCNSKCNSWVITAHDKCTSIKWSEKSETKNISDHIIENKKCIYFWTPPIM